MTASKLPLPNTHSLPDVTHDYTVILLYPSYVWESDPETYAVDIRSALHPLDAVTKARSQCLQDNSWFDDDDTPIHDPNDFVPLYIFNGIAPELTFTSFDHVPGEDDIPKRACVGCGNGLWPSNTSNRCQPGCRNTARKAN